MAPAQCSPLKKAQSFQLIEDRPLCQSPIDQKVQEVIRPAMLVVDSNGNMCLIFEETK